MNSGVVPENGYLAVDGNPLAEPSALPQSAGESAVRLTRGASLIVVLLSSLGLWAVIWAVVASFLPHGLL